ncbi:ROK family protein [Pedobacter heparinus]|uniref:ROK family protein n=1 Tax=Pedobacter heparinus TaxID=984 RepID=UPI00292D2F45|nr:ROK family protein [Pedobacter heparinus]
MDNYFLTFDIGGTRVKYGMVSPSGKLLRSGSFASPVNDGAAIFFNILTKNIDKILAETAGELEGIGLGLSGGVDPDFGVVLLPGKFKGLEGFPVVKLLRERYDCPVMADNDGRLAAYAEKYYGAAMDIDWAVVVTLGTGVGSGVIVDGKILMDRHLLFGTQLGHLIINKTADQTCLTGNRGTGEIFCSSTALALQVKSAIQRGIPSILTDLYFENPNAIDFQSVSDACRAGDRLCLQEMGVWIDNLSILLINAVHAYGPERIILSGGASLSADLFLDKLTEKVNKQVFRYSLNQPVEIIVSSMQDFAGVLGAAAMIIEKSKIKAI